MTVKAMRAISGTLTAGLVVLALVIVGAEVLGQYRRFPGPGMTSVAWHVGVAIVAVVLQRFADRWASAVTVLCSVAIVAATALLLWTQWWR